MRTLHLYLTRRMLATLGMTVFVFTLVLLLGNVIKEILQLVMHRQATLTVAIEAIALLLPYLLAFSLPIGMLTAALLVFGRFSAEQELTAARASGVSLISLVTPVLLLAVGMSVLCAWLNMDVAPASRVAYKRLLYEATLDTPGALLRSGESIPIGNLNVFAGKVASDGTNLENVIVSRYDKGGHLDLLAQGSSGKFIPDLEHHLVTLILQNEHGMQKEPNGWFPLATSDSGTFPLAVEPRADKRIAIPPSDMTFQQLLDRMDEIERTMSAPPAKGLSNKQLAQMRQDLSDAKKEESTPVLVYMNQQAAFSFACLGFTLVGIPLGIRGHRRETSAGVAIALVLMLVYYAFLVLAQAWSIHPERFPYLIVWVPNFVFQALGAVLLWKANRGGS